LSLVFAGTEISWHSGCYRKIFFFYQKSVEGRRHLSVNQGAENRLGHLDRND